MRRAQASITFSGRLLDSTSLITSQQQPRYKGCAKPGSDRSRPGRHSGVRCHFIVTSHQLKASKESKPLAATQVAKEFEEMQSSRSDCLPPVVNRLRFVGSLENKPPALFRRPPLPRAAGPGSSQNAHAAEPAGGRTHRAPADPIHTIQRLHTTRRRFFDQSDNKLSSIERKGRGCGPRLSKRAR